MGLEPGAAPTGGNSCILSISVVVYGTVTASPALFTFKTLTPERLSLVHPPEKFTQGLDVGCNRKAQRGCSTRCLQGSLPASPGFQPSWGTLGRGRATAGGFGPLHLKSHILQLQQSRVVAQTGGQDTAARKRRGNEVFRHLLSS